MLCQAYTAVIYASGTVLFRFGLRGRRRCLDALRTINAQITEMSPALLNGGPRSKSVMSRTILIRPNKKFPMVNAALFQYPDGDIAAGRQYRFPCRETKFDIGGLQAAARMFAAEGQRGKGAEGQREMELTGRNLRTKSRGTACGRTAETRGVSGGRGDGATHAGNGGGFHEGRTGGNRPARGCHRDRPPGAPGEESYAQPLFRPAIQQGGAGLFPAQLGARP